MMTGLNQPINVLASDGRFYRRQDFWGSNWYLRVKPGESFIGVVVTHADVTITEMWAVAVKKIANIGITGRVIESHGFGWAEINNERLRVAMFSVVIVEPIPASLFGSGDVGYRLPVGQRYLDFGRAWG